AERRGASATKRTLNSWMRRSALHLPSYSEGGKRVEAQSTRHDKWKAERWLNRSSARADRASLSRFDFIEPLLPWAEHQGNRGRHAVGIREGLINRRPERVQHLSRLRRNGLDPRGPHQDILDRHGMDVSGREDRLVGRIRVLVPEDGGRDEE